MAYGGTGIAGATGGTGTTGRDQWDQTIIQINNLVEQHKNSSHQADVYRSITKRHFKPTKSATQCANTACKRRVFSNTDWKYHCFRCGEVFCKRCVKQKIRLNNLAQPDPYGQEYNVCVQCAKYTPQPVGQTRNLTVIFGQYRQYRHNLSASVLHQPVKQPRGKLDIDAECRRLKAGFRDNMMKNHVKRLLHEVKNMYCSPDWQKSSLYNSGANASQCYNCCSQFTLLKRKADCCICGQFICPDCSSTDLLIYVPDQMMGAEEAQPEITVIKIVGCPTEEPAVCLYLRVCDPCRAYLQQKQVDKFYDDKLQAAMNDSWRAIVEVADTAIRAKSRIESYLPHYRDLVDSLEQEVHVPKSGDQNTSNIHMLAKGQEDLSDYFTQLVVTIHGLKRMNPETKGQTTILRHLTQAMCRSYQEYTVMYRELRSRLEEVTPVNVLRAIQDIVEKNTINGAYLAIRQLAYETIHLCDKHKIDTELPQQIVSVEKEMYDELKERILKAEEDWVVHEAVFTQMLQIQLKEHRFIRPSRQLTQKHGSPYVRHFMLERADSVVQRVGLQLSVKCLDRSFHRSKHHLDILNGYLADAYQKRAVSNQVDGALKSPVSGQK